MRHTAHIKLNKLKLTYSLALNFKESSKKSANTDESDHKEEPHKALSDDDCVLYALRVNQIQTKVQNFLKSTKKRKSVFEHSNKKGTHSAKSSAPNFDRIHHNTVRSLFEKAIAASSADKNTNSIFQLYVDEMYKEFFFHHNYSKCLETPQTIRCIYPTLSMIEHSCDPNCFLVYE